MLNINCILADIVNKIRIAEEYGMCTEELISILSYVSSWQWLYNNAWDCLSVEQKSDIEVFLKMHFNCKSFTTCESVTEECFDTPPIANDECVDARIIGYPTNSSPTYTISNLTNTYTCGVRDYPTESVGIPTITWTDTSTGDIWYKFNTGNSIILNPYITVGGGTMKFPQLALYIGSDCGTLSLIADVSFDSEAYAFVRPTLLNNANYWLRISNSGGNTNTGSFSITISLDPIV